MTVICGFVDKKTGKVYVGADRGIFSDVDESFFISPEPKILKKKIGEWNKKPIWMIIGNAGDVKPGNIITHWQTSRLKFDPSIMTPHEFLVKKFVPEMERQFKAKGYTKPENFDLLVAFEGEMFYIDGAYSVSIPSTWGFAVGGAGPQAAGALYVLNNSKIKNKISPKEKIKMAILASINTTNLAKPPIDILTV